MKVAKALTTSIIGRGIYFLSVLLLNILVARHFEADGSGQIYYVTNIFAFAMMLVSLCLETPMGYYLSQKKLSETQLTVLALGWTILVMIPAYFVIKAFSGTEGIPFAQTSFEFSANVFLAGNLLITFFVAMFYAKLDFIVPNLLASGVNLVLILLVPNKWFVGQQLVTDDQYITIYFCGFLLQGFLLSAFFIFKYVKWKEFRLIPVPLVKSLFSFALVAVLTNSMTFLMYRIDYWFVNKYCSAADLGNYIQACKLAQLFFIIPSILAGVVFPMTASGRREEMNEKMQLLSRGLILMYLIACTGLAAVGYWLFPFVFGETFNNMYQPFVLLIPAVLSYSVIHLLAAYYSGKKVLRVNLLGNVMALSIIIVGDLLVIPRFGITGAALVSSIGYICYMSFMLLAHRREYKTRFADFLIVRKKDAQLIYKLLAEKLASRKTEAS
jgi:O-antigen/teichoic acid export membrane protein